MSTKTVLRLSWVFGFLIAPSLGLALPPQWTIIPEESQLSFTATQNDAPVTGSFKQFSGDILVDPNDLASSSIDIIVDMNSIYASYSDLKDTLITADWFNVKLFPQAEFKAKGIQKLADDHYQTTGTLRIRDKSVPVTLTFEAKQPVNDKGLVEGSTVLKRTLFGVGQGEWSSTNEVKDDVTVHFKVAAVKKK